MSGPRPPGSGLSADPHQCTAVDRQRHAGDEIGFVGSEKQRCIRDVPCCSHPATQRNLGIALRSDLGAAAVAGPSARVDGHWRIHESWQNAGGANAVWSVLQSELFGEGDHCRFGRLVGDEGVAVLARSHRRNVDDGTGALQAHDRQYVLASHDRAAQVDRADAVEGLLAQFVQRLVATPDADPDIFVQDINAAPARPSRLHRGGERLFLGHVGGEGYALATLRRHRGGLLGGGDKPVDRQDPGAFLREAERRRTAVPDPLTGALPGANDYSDLAFETHGSTPATGVQGCLYGASLRKSARASRLLAYRILYPRCARVAGREAWEPEPGRPGTIEDEPGWEERFL